MRESSTVAETNPLRQGLPRTRVSQPCAVVLFGATGMVGAGALLECLDDPRVSSVLVLGRHPCGVAHGKLTEILVEDFLQYDAVRPRLSAADACFWHFLPEIAMFGFKIMPSSATRWIRNSWNVLFSTRLVTS